MNAQMILAIANLFAVAVEGGLTIQAVIAQVRETGVVPEEEWALLDDALAAGEDFWKEQLDG